MKRRTEEKKNTFNGHLFRIGFNDSYLKYNWSIFINSYGLAGIFLYTYSFEIYIFFWSDDFDFEWKWPSFQMNKLIRTNAQNKWIFLDNVIKSKPCLTGCRLFFTVFGGGGSCFGIWFILIIAIIVFQFFSLYFRSFFFFTFDSSFEARSRYQSIFFCLTLRKKCLFCAMPFEEETKNIHNNIHPNYFRTYRNRIDNVSAMATFTKLPIVVLWCA